MKFKKAGFVVAGILLLILAFFNRKDIELTKQDQISIKPISQSGYELSSVIHLHNPNLLSSTIKTVNENFYINGQSIGAFKMDLSQGVAGMKDSEFPITIRFTKDDYSKGLMRDSTNASITLRMDGEIDFQNLLSGGKIKIQQSQPLQKL
ncbi:MAG: hypothetical protein JWO06_1678 [Bacteroidota bacterium]|nr:hypothetical protein [Bacteroidota bacterium]